MTFLQLSGQKPALRFQTTAWRCDQTAMFERRLGSMLGLRLGLALENMKYVRTKRNHVANTGASFFVPLYLRAHQRKLISPRR